MLKVKSPRDLRIALRRYRKFKANEVKYRALVEKYRDLVVRFMETKNKKVVEDDEGNKYQKRQAVRITYPEDAKDLRALLRKKGVEPGSVIGRVTTTTTVVSEDEILRLLKRKVISAKEFEAVIIRQTYTPFIVKLDGKKGKKISREGKGKLTKAVTGSRGRS